MTHNHILITNFNSNPNVGLYVFATDEYCLVGRDVPIKTIKEIEKVLSVPVHIVSICGTSLLGVFCAGNKKCLLIPSIAFESEMTKLDELGIRYSMIDTKLTALGNNILCNDKGAIVSHDFEESTVKQISLALGVPVVKSKISGLDIIGSLATLNSNGKCLIHHDIESFEKKLVEKNLGVICIEGTVNMGSPYISSGVVTNKNGFIIGSLSGGPEIDNADKAFGFMD
ncbi:translation initiation factor IF-6 [Candidatus Woesearchaeota archaeon CG11_big_fil_rev_8_21_14_0_20_43_8]|nr:MAG: translation initiation factor IF-6 [Candidatus Woesearchaeota archaeon CG11_big_fil_rev_8_21_14_0_20_43_8]PIO05727.1 MAG: translation initiation factor IF-6 [Candidatus Woesearchaeota archaeon CG08_land_8_20_14_0_20_43_7]